MSAGETAIAIGFGSMSSKDAAATTGIVLDAIQQVGCRAILLSGWGGFSDAKLPDNLFCIDALYSEVVKTDAPSFHTAVSCGGNQV